MKTGETGRRFTSSLLAAQLGLLLLCSGPGTRSLCAQGASPAPEIDREAQAKRRPQVFLSVFNNGYAHDNLPTNAVQFERLIKTISTEGHFNTVLCAYSPERLALCKKYGVKLMVDLLCAPQHIYRNPKECEELCTRLRHDPTVVGYHLWSDRFGKQGAGRAHDIDNVHTWDPTHATYSGTYRNEGIHHLAKSDLVAYYDFCWKRGVQSNFPHLLGAWKQARLYDNRLGRFIECDAGQPGKGNVNRSLFTINTSIACGLRTVLWFIGSGQMNMETQELNEAGRDAGKVNAWLKPLWQEIPKLGLPTAIYATPVTRDFNDRPASTNNVAVKAPGLENCEFPKDFWIQPVSGEFVMGLSKYNGTAEDAVYVANLNAYAGQDVKLKLGRKTKALLYSREAGQYEELKSVGDEIGFKLEPAGSALLRFP